MKILDSDALRACGGYHFENHYISFTIHRYAWGEGHALYVRDSWLDGAWAGTCSSKDCNDELMPPLNIGNGRA